MSMRKRLPVLLMALLLVCTCACAKSFVITNDPLTPDSTSGAPGGSPNVFFVEKDGSLTAVEKPSYCPKALSAGELSVASATASSHITTKKEDFAPYKVLDNSDDTTWQFEISKVGNVKNAYIDLTLNSPSAVNQVWIKQGFWRIAFNLDQYIRNGRPSEVELTFRYEGSKDFVEPMLFSIPDTRENGYYEMDVGWKQNVAAVRMRICNVILGSYFPDDVAVSEMRVVGIPMSKWPDDMEAAMAHQTETRIVEQPTCAQSGREVEYCTACEQVMNEKTIPAGQHVAGLFVDEMLPDCVNPGVSRQSCTVCGTVLQEVEIPPFGHFEGTPVKENGEEHIYCLICNAQIQ